MENKIESKILDLFLYNNSLKFNEIEKSLKIHSNKLSYHLKNLIKKNILEKQNQTYSVSEDSEYLIPYLSNKKAILPVVLICIGNKSSCFLYQRTKRPYKNKLSLPGGRILIGESIKKAVLRIMKEKFNINTNFKKINSISIEHIKKPKSNKIIHSFLLIFVSAVTKNKIQLTNPNKNRSKIISSDYKLIKDNLNKKIKINIIYSKL